MVVEPEIVRNDLRTDGPPPDGIFIPSAVFMPFIAQEGAGTKSLVGEGEGRGPSHSSAGRTGVRLAEASIA